MVSQNISKETEKKVLITCLVISVCFTILRTGARWFKLRHPPFEPEDIAISIALASFIIMISLYLAALETLFNIEAVMNNLLPPYPAMKTDIYSMLREFFAVQLFFWLTLWAVKCSLLFMFQKLTTGIRSYTRIWWGVVVFTVLTFVGCVVSQFTSCSSMHAWFSAGECSTPRDAVAKSASLWYSLAADLLTDLMIMFVPIRILYTLKITTAHKFSVGIVFSVGIITMIFAIVRVISLDASVAHGQVNTTWLILWAGLEGATAIVVGCLPAFAVFIRGRVEASRITKGSSTQSASNFAYHGSKHRSRARVPGVSTADIEDVQLDKFERKKTRRNSHETESIEGLVDVRRAGEGIQITRSWEQKWQYGNEEDAVVQRLRDLDLKRGAGAV